MSIFSVPNPTVDTHIFTSLLNLPLDCMLVMGSKLQAGSLLWQARAEAIRKGEAISPDSFDSNCITPGTPFMARLGAHLRYFVRKKIAEDPAWQRPHVIFSGAFVHLTLSEVPFDGNTRMSIFAVSSFT